MSVQEVTLRDKRNPLCTVQIAVMKEIARAEGLHGRMTLDLQRAHLILAEEVGEFAKAVADTTRVHIGHAGRERYERQAQNFGKARDELIQVISTAMQILENLLTRPEEVLATCQTEKQS